MLLSSFLGTEITVVSNFASNTSRTQLRGNGNSNNNSGSVVTIECSSRPQKKATAHHMKTRPRKTQPWDINRKPTVYAPLPPLPPDWTLLSDDTTTTTTSDSTNGGGALAGPEAALPSPPVLQAPLASG